MMGLRNVLAIGILLTGSAWAAEVLHVDRRSTAQAPAGTSWQDAFASLQEAIDHAATNNDTEIWIKAGVYKPAGDVPSSTFQLQPGLALFGGFRGKETERTQRNPRLNRTVLSGDIGRSGHTADNCQHVVTGASDCRVDGLIIISGQAGVESGGGLLIPAGTTGFTAANCSFEKNRAQHGGGLYAESATLQLTNCTFFANAAESGGAAAVNGCVIRARDCSFSSNFAQQSGGALYLSNGINAGFTASSFMLNSTDGVGGAITAEENDKDAPFGLHGCLFSENTATSNGLAMHIGGELRPLLIDCSFELSNTGDLLGSLSATSPAFYLISNCSFVRNSGAASAGIDKFIAVEIDSGEVDLAYFANAPSAGSPRPELPSARPETIKKPEVVVEFVPEPKRVLAAAQAHDATGAPVNLRDLATESRLVIFTLGDLTDPRFTRAYRNVEAAALDYPSDDIRFFHIYRALSHPENHGYVQPMNKKERQRHLQLAQELLHTQIPWLYDSLENSALNELIIDPLNNLFIFNAQGEEEYQGQLSDVVALQDILTDLVGPSEASTRPSSLPAPDIDPVKLPVNKHVKRIVLNAARDPFFPLLIKPVSPNTAHYVKPRLEVNKSLLQTGDGKFYLGFHIDPLYQLEWNPVGDPIEYIIKVPAGTAVAPSIGSGPKSGLDDSESEPREFMLEARNLNPGMEFTLQISYSIRSIKTKRTSNITQRYIVRQELDPWGGKVVNRQIVAKDLGRVVKKPAPKKRGFADLLKRYDIDLDGKISRDEANSAMRRVFDDVDTNRDGYVDKTEYLKR